MKEIVNTILRSDGVLEIYVGNRLLVEVADGKSDEAFIEDVLYGLGYYWLHDGTIVKRPEIEKPITKQSIYDEMCRVLTEYEDGSDMVTENELYAMLVKIQNNWGSRDYGSGGLKMEMNVGMLKEIIANLPNDMQIFVGCEGYCNYNFKEGQPWDDTDTFAIVHDGKLFITDACAIETETGETI